MIDPAALAATHAAAFDHDRSWSAAEFATLLEQPGVLLTGDPLAYVLGRILLDEAEILTIASHPSARRQGLARAALSAFERHAAASGVISAFLEVAEDNMPARSLYESQGYMPMGRRRDYYARPDGPAVAALILRKTIAPA